jgi:hypothetical protein
MYYANLFANYFKENQPLLKPNSLGLFADKHLN